MVEGLQQADVAREAGRRERDVHHRRIEGSDRNGTSLLSTHWDASEWEDRLHPVPLLAVLNASLLPSFSQVSLELPYLICLELTDDGHRGKLIRPVQGERDPPVRLQALTELSSFRCSRSSTYLRQAQLHLRLQRSRVRSPALLLPRGVRQRQDPETGKPLGSGIYLEDRYEVCLSVFRYTSLPFN